MHAPTYKNFHASGHARKKKPATRPAVPRLKVTSAVPRLKVTSAVPHLKVTMDSELQVDAVDLPSTHASRHPGKLIIPPRKHTDRGKASAEKATNAVRRALKREQQAAMEADIQDFVEYRNALAKELASKYGKSIPYMYAQLSRVLLLKQRRHSNVRNALVAKRSRELNASRSKGNRYSLQEVQAIVKAEVEEGKHADVEELEELLADHNEGREDKKTGARSSNRAATLDYNACCDRVREELANMSERCGSVGFAVFTRGHVHDTITPGWCDSQGAVAFLNEVLEITPYDLVKKFEIWACAKDRNAHRLPAQRKNTTEALRSECINMIANGLRRKKINMQYERYAVEIVDKHGVELQGWPTGIKFRSPANISVTEELTSLRDALACGECKWVKLNRKEIEARAKERKEKIASVEITVRKRKTRKDKGEKRGPNKATTGKRKQGSRNDNHEAADADGNDEEAGGPRGKRANVGKQLPPGMAALSTEFVRDSSDEEAE
ncbi:hypothetical protein H0H92_013925 [Tricholoma furcatifolium]|nr:hypothetical protein H0H92_013925 [Tricholoma furcatifolium]